MHYFFIVFIILTVLFILLSASSQKRRKHQLEQIRINWGKVKSDYCNFHLINRYYNVSKHAYFHKLSNQTVADIDLFDLFHYIDRTSSKPGQQLLFDRLNKPTDNIEELKDLYKKALFFEEHPLVREEVQLLLLALNTNDAYYIADLLQHKLLKRPKWFSFLYLNTVVATVLVFLLPKFLILIIPLMLLFAINLFLHYWNKNNTSQFSRSLPQLNKLIHIAKQLNAKDLPFDSTVTKQSINALGAFQKKIRLIGFGGAGIKDELAQAIYYFIDLIKALFLVEVHTLYNVTKELENKQESIDNLLRYVGNIDIAITIASIKTGARKNCEPEFIPDSKTLRATSLYHPLIENCVENTIAIDGKSVLITGSNMSGKTTFLRTIAINSLLAQTLYICFAERFILPILKLHSSIRIDDSLLDAKSYYFEEVNTMASLISEVGSGHQNLFLLDEVFKGTNTIERIAAAKAVLSYLNQGSHIVLVSTHDIELSEWLTNEYELYHFSEIIHDNQLQFDHKLKEGLLQTRNAIRILELSGYPATIIKEAQQLSNSLTKEAVK